MDGHFGVVFEWILVCMDGDVEVGRMEGGGREVKRSEV